MKRSKKIAALLFALMMSVMLAAPCTSFGYDNTLPAQEQATEASEPANGNPDENTTEPSVTDTTSETEATTEITTTTTTVETTTQATTAPDPVYNGPNAKRIPIITYHRICSAAEKKHKNQRKSSLFLTVGTFEKQMRWLYSHHYRTISTEEFYKWYTGKIKLPKKSVLITFDDGSYSVIKYALPVLKKYNMKATMFMIGASTHKTTYKNLCANGSYSSVGEDVMNEVKSTYPKFEFQSHTYNMHRKIKRKPALKKYGYAQQRADFTTMYNKYGYTFLAYPYGKYSNNSIKAAKASHVKMAFTYGTNAYAKKSQNRYKIKRIKISANQSMKKFYRWFIK